MLPVVSVLAVQIKDLNWTWNRFQRDMENELIRLDYFVTEQEEELHILGVGMQLPMDIALFWNDL